MRDSNPPDINRTSQGVQLRDGRLISLINDNHLKECVEEPTRKPNIVDLVISTEEQLLVEPVTVK